jgi:hypothetical protein
LVRSQRRQKRTPGQTGVRSNSSARRPASDPISRIAGPQSNKCDVAASCPHSIFVKRLECCADQLCPPPKAVIRRSNVMGRLGAQTNASAGLRITAPVHKNHDTQQARWKSFRGEVRSFPPRKPIIPFSSGTAEAFRVERIARLDQPAFSLLHHN